MAAPNGGAASEPRALAQMTLHQRVMIRVPRRAPVKPIVWRERGAPRCHDLAGLAGASFLKPGSVELYFNDGRRLRAVLGNNCSAIDFYSGFYIRPREDGRVCARRDAARSRSGAVCEIRTFKWLVEKR
ncbi:MAG: hypothetical protein C0476_02070 [Sphingomonas sp.]|nr:hypothetical protein [Sphingomonas sp.]